MVRNRLILRLVDARDGKRFAWDFSVRWSGILLIVRLIIYSMAAFAQRRKTLTKPLERWFFVLAPTFFRDCVGRRNWSYLLRLCK